MSSSCRQLLAELGTSCWEADGAHLGRRDRAGEWNGTLIGVLRECVPVLTSVAGDKQGGRHPRRTSPEPQGKPSSQTHPGQSGVLDNWREWGPSRLTLGLSTLSGG